ncbi:MAG TPA: ATP-binding protein [Rubrivivax sp.]|nr:ATP-binding protein [Rubrivivax sp.]
MAHSPTQTFSARMDSLPPATRFVQDFCAQHGVAAADVLRLTLVVEELLTNSIVHGHGGGGDAPVQLRLAVGESQLALHFEDQAPPFDPLRYLAEAAPRLDLGAEERQVGGLGLPLVAQMAEQFDYVHADGRNRLRLVLRRGA